jgi:hypothetical protein
MRLLVIDNGREPYALLVEAPHTQRLRLEYSNPETVTATPATVVIDRGAVAVPLLLVGSAM